MIRFIMPLNGLDKLKIVLLPFSSNICGLTTLFAEPSTSPPRGEGTSASKRRIKSKLLMKGNIWSNIRRVTPGQQREVGSVVEYQQCGVVLTVKLFSKSIVVESVYRTNDASTTQSFPVAPAYRSINLEDYYTGLLDMVRREDLYTNPPLKGTVNVRNSPLTIPLITLPLRLPGFNPSVIREFTTSIDILVIRDERIARVAFDRIEERTVLAQVTQIISDKGKPSYEVNGQALSKPFVKELRSILNILSSSNRPTTSYLNTIKGYLYVLSYSIHRLNRLHTSAENEQGTTS